MTAVLLVFAIVLFVTVCLVIISIYRADKIAKDIVYLYEHPEIRKEYEKRAFEYGQREYSSSVNTKKYITLFKELVRQ